MVIQNCATHIPLGQTKPKRPCDEAQEPSTQEPGTFAGHAPPPEPPAPVLACLRAPSHRSLPAEAGAPRAEPPRGRDITVLPRHRQIQWIPAAVRSDPFPSMTRNRRPPTCCRASVTLQQPAGAARGTDDLRFRCPCC